jgi:iron complex transport system substrate-binding protein
MNKHKRYSLFWLEKYVETCRGLFGTLCEWLGGVAWGVVACIVAALVVPLVAQAAGVEVTDDRGRVVQLPAPPQRVVSLLPSLTETVCELGQCQRLVGVDRYSNFPANVKALPQLGGGLDPSIEAVVAARPDLVLVAASSRAADRLEALGLKVVVLEPKTHADVQRVLRKVAQALGQPVAEADRVWRHIDAAVSAAAQSLPASARSTRVYFEVNRAPYGAGASSFIGETLTRLGVKNILPPELGPFPKINPEFVVRANPDLIMVGDRNFAGMTDRPGWQRMRAVSEKRLCVFKPDDSDVLVRPGPRMAEAARLMADCITRMAAKP